MQLKTVTWNIGGGKYLKEGADRLLMASYSVDAISNIADWLKTVDPDIIALQEAQADSSSNQVEEIAKLINFKYHYFDATSSSHIDEGKSLGNGLISKYPISEHRNGLFFNPNIEAERQGKIIRTHDKGFGRCVITLGELGIEVATLHLLPFQAFSIDLKSEIGGEILSSVTKEIALSNNHSLVMGDFNIDSPTVGEYLPKLFDLRGVEEISLDEPTIPSGKQYDHVIYRGFSLNKVVIDNSVKTDHYPVTCSFTVLV